jgi:hypothetical protein
MSTIRVAKRQRFVRIDSRSVNDATISFRARGVLAWLLEKPDDWSASIEAIARQGTEGREAVATALRELESGGYIVRRKWRGDDGKYHAECVVFEHPSFATDHDGFLGLDHDGFPEPGKPEQVSWGTYSREPLTEVQQNNDSTQPASPPAPKAKKPMWEEASTIAKAEWERRSPKPVIPFVAFLDRIREALVAGWSAEQVAQVLPQMPAFGRGNFDFALGRLPKPPGQIDYSERQVTYS